MASRWLRFQVPFSCPCIQATKILCLPFKWVKVTFKTVENDFEGYKRNISPHVGS